MSTVEQKVAAIRALKRGWTSRRDEVRILEMLESCEGAELDAVLRELDPRKLLSDLNDRRLGARNVTRLVRLLTVDRLDDLSLETRARVIWGMQHGHTTPLFEHAIRTIMLDSTGEDLRKLRNLINTTGDHQDLEKLVFSDVENQEVRAEILNHIQVNAEPTTEMKVLSDIDDTVFARLHDRRYPGKSRYPGVLAFFNALDRGPDGSGQTGDLTFVTARPTLFSGLVERFTRKSLRAAGITNKVVLTGGLWALRSHRSMAKRKLNNIRNYHALFPEYGLVFVGDSGQGDVEVGKLLLRELPNAMAGVFIHDVKQTSLEERDLHAEAGIDFFNTYIAAAALAAKRGVISAEQAHEVGEAAMRDLEELTLLPAQMRADRLAEHEADLKVMDEALVIADVQ